MNSSDDSSLRRHFESLREEDRQSTPGFLNTVTAANARATRRQRWRNRALIRTLVLAAAIVVVAAVWFSRSTPPRTHDARSLTSWSSPTAFLLEPPAKQLWRDIPPLGGKDIYGLPAARKERR